jgi:hypothetical protein
VNHIKVFAIALVFGLIAYAVTLGLVHLTHRLGLI